MGIGFELARTWDGGRDVERRLKSWHKSRLLCPICQHSQPDGIAPTRSER
jgi:hypothetical protein